MLVITALGLRILLAFHKRLGYVYMVNVVESKANVDILHLNTHTFTDEHSFSDWVYSNAAIMWHMWTF